MHAHRATRRVACALGMVVVVAREPGVGPGDVAIGVVLQFEGGCLGVRLCFEEGPPRLCALGERGGEKGGERVREEGVHFGGVQYWLVGRTGMGSALLSLVAGGNGRDRLTVRVLSRISTTTLCVS